MVACSVSRTPACSSRGFDRPQVICVGVGDKEPVSRKCGVVRPPVSSQRSGQDVVSRVPVLPLTSVGPGESLPVLKGRELDQMVFLIPSSSESVTLSYFISPLYLLLTFELSWQSPLTQKENGQSPALHCVSNCLLSKVHRTEVSLYQVIDTRLTNLTLA